MIADRNPSAGTRSASAPTVVRAADAQPREFLGILFDLLATGDRRLVTRMRHETGMTVATHHHEHEQASYHVPRPRTIHDLGHGTIPGSRSCFLLSRSDDHLAAGDERPTSRGLRGVGPQLRAAR